MKLHLWLRYCTKALWKDPSWKIHSVNQKNFLTGKHSKLFVKSYQKTHKERALVIQSITKLLITECLWNLFSTIFRQIFDELQISSILNLRIIKARLKKHSVIPKVTLVLQKRKKGFDASLSFIGTNSGEVIKLIKSLNIVKACENANIITKILKLNGDLFANYISRNSIIVLKKVNFLVCLNILTLYLYIRK